MDTLDIYFIREKKSGAMTTGAGVYFFSPVIWT